jgi:hypothetical protein
LLILGDPLTSTDLCVGCELQQSCLQRLQELKCLISPRTF